MLGFLNIAVGGGLLLAGRKLFWLFVGAIGFTIGLELASRFPFRSQWTIILVSLGLGVVFALLAVFVETVAIGIAGFVGGGLGLMRFAVLLGLDSPFARTLAFIVGAIVGVALIVWLFNWALIILSSVAGASLVAAGLFLTDVQRPLVYAVLVMTGILVQAIAMAREHGPTKPVST